MRVYFEPHETIEAALSARRISSTGHANGREISLSNNPDWRDLYDEIIRRRGRWIARLSPAMTSVDDPFPHPSPDADAFPQLSRGEPERGSRHGRSGRPQWRGQDQLPGSDFLPVA